MKYAAERRAADRQDRVAGIPAREDWRKAALHPSQVPIAHTRIDDFLMAHDTTCVDAIDKDGIMFSATPSGSWLPSVVAGDTGIPLTERAQSFLLVPGIRMNWRAESVRASR